MAYPWDNDPTQPPEPWSWVPPEWQEAAELQQPVIPGLETGPTGADPFLVAMGQLPPDPNAPPPGIEAPAEPVAPIAPEEVAVPEGPAPPELDYRPVDVPVQAAAAAAGVPVAPALPPSVPVQPELDATKVALSGVEREEKRRQLGLDFTANEQARIREEREGLIQKQAEVDQHLAKMAEEKIEPGWDADTGQTIAGFLMAAIQGWMNPRGPNSALEMIERITERQMRAKQADLQNRRAALGDQRAGMVAALTENAHQWNMIGEQAATAMAQFDPNGTAWQRGAEVIVTAQQNRDKAKAEAAKAAWEMQKEDRELGVKEGGLRETMRSNRAQEGLEYAKIREAAAARAATAKAEGKKDEAARLEKANARAIWPLSSEGKLFEAPTEKVAEAVNGKLGAVETVVNGLERMDELYAKVGYDIGAMGDDDRKRLDALHKVVSENLSVAQEQGVIMEGEVKRLGSTLGEPGSWYNERPRLEEVKQAMIRRANSTLRNQTSYRGNWKPKALRGEGAGTDEGFISGGLPTSYEEQQAQRRREFEESARRGREDLRRLSGTVGNKL